jgi:hypothetical protein
MIENHATEISKMNKHFSAWRIMSEQYQRENEEDHKLKMQYISLSLEEKTKIIKKPKNI